MAKVIITCGKLCSGKTTYSETLCQKLPAVLFSIDDLTMLLLGPYPGDVLDEYFEKLQGYFYKKAADTAKNGVNVVLDLGLWQKSERLEAREFFKAEGVDLEIHYLKISDSLWRERIKNRNESISDQTRSSENPFKPLPYFVDENLLKKFESFFEEPDEQEVDKIILQG